jgi:TPR repeat protein
MTAAIPFLDSTTPTLLASPSATIQQLVSAADHSFEFEHWADAFLLYSKVEERTLKEGVKINGHVCYRMGVMYARGNYVKKDYAKALSYFKKALVYLTPICESDPEARCDLAYMLENGYGVQEDKVKAVEYYRIAANQGFARAQVNLGYMYSNGYGVECDKAQAVKYYKMAADQGYTNAFTNLGFMASNGYGMAQDKKMAVRYYKKAAKRGYARGLCNLGYMYDYGYGVPHSKVLAAKYYSLAAEQGYSVAQCNLAYMYQYGFGVPLNKKIAVYYYQLAADQSYPRALCNLAEMYIYGDESAGISLDPKKAVLYFIWAADQEYERANTYLSRLLSGDTHRSIALEYLSDLWPTLTMTKSFEFKNQIFEETLSQIFKGSVQFQNYTSIALYHLMKEWPNAKANALLHPSCKHALETVTLILRQHIQILPDLQPLILKAIVGNWKIR